MGGGAARASGARRPRRSGAPAVAALALGGLAGARGAVANAQPRWDIGAQVGAAERLTTSHPAGNPAALPGPQAEVQAHVALLPMVRVGAYAAYDASPADGRSVREITAVGVHVRLVPPLLGAPWRTWVFAGAGYAGAYQPGFVRAGFPGGFVAGAGGGFVDFPLGVGVGVRFRPPWTLTAELGARFGGWFAGALYHPRACGCGARDEDSFAVTVSVGVSFDR